MPKCHVCGGAEFVKEEGFMYCSECQTRCKGVSEQVFDPWVGGPQIAVKTTIKKQKNIETKVGNWTTWEAYNFVLKGMVDELLKLGASPKLKIVVFQLWARYLQKINVAFLTRNRKIPKLGVSYKNRDAHVLFSWPLKSGLKKKCKSTAGSSSCLSISGERSKARRAFVQAKQDKESTLGSEFDTSNYSDNQSASSAPSLPWSSKSYLSRKNKYMSEEAVDFKRRERRREKVIEKQPWKNKIKVKPTAVTFISKVKLLAIIHLGLLLCEDDIQLSDLLRWIREGHLSYCSVIHFLPTKMTTNGVCIRGLEFQHAWPSHLLVRRVAGKLVAVLGIESLPIPFLPNLIRRYVKELELPGALADFAVHLWGDSQPRMLLKSEIESERILKVNNIGTAVSNEIPNYEGRAMAILLFSMKLLFALDGFTEQILSKFAYKANKILCLSDGTNSSDPKESGHFPCKLFVWKDWVKYIEFRNSLISRWHYPMHAAREPGTFQLDHEKSNIVPAMPPSQNVMQYLSFCQYVIKSKLEDKDEKKDPNWMKFMRKHLQELTEMDPKPGYNVQNFKPSTTPCHSYMDELCKANINHWQKIDETIGNGPCNQLLHAKFCFTSIDFILKPRVIIKALEQKNVCVDLNSDSVLSVKGSKYVKFHEPTNGIIQWNEANNFMIVDFSHNFEEKKKKIDWLSLKNKHQLLNQIQAIESDLLKVKSKGKELKSPGGKGSTAKKRKIKHPTKDIVSGPSAEGGEDLQRLKLMLPYRKIWMFYTALKDFNEERFNELRSRLPSSFSWLLHLCANLLEMSELSLYNELINVELVHKNIKHSKGSHVQNKRYECFRTCFALATW